MSRPTTETDRASLAAKAAALTPAQRALLERKLRERAAAAPREKPIVRRGQTVAPLSFAQELLWLVDQLSPDKVNYTVPRIMRLKGPLNVAAMERTLTTIVERHEVLRTSITVVDGAAVQTVRPANPITIRVIDLTSEPLAAREDARDRNRQGTDSASVRLEPRRSAAADGDPPGRRRVHFPARIAPHRVGRLVEGCALQRARDALRRALSGPAVRAA